MTMIEAYEAELASILGKIDAARSEWADGLEGGSTAGLGGMRDRDADALHALKVRLSDVRALLAVERARPVAAPWVNPAGS